MKRIAILFVAAALGACATTKQNVPTADMAFLAPGNALIKVERRTGLIGSGRSLEISDDGKVVGQLAPGDHLIWQRPAGTFELQLVRSALAVSAPVPLKVDAEPGKEYDFEVFWGGATFELHRK